MTKLAHGHWCTFTDLYHTIPATELTNILARGTRVMDQNGISGQHAYCATVRVLRSCLFVECVLGSAFQVSPLFLKASPLFFVPVSIVSNSVMLI